MQSGKLEAQKGSANKIPAMTSQKIHSETGQDLSETDRKLEELKGPLFDLNLLFPLALVFLRKAAWLRHLTT